MPDSVLIVTPARNEAHQIRMVIESVLKQTLQPWRYYLVSDASDDGTDEIMKEYATQYDFIHYIRRDKPREEFDRVESVSPGQIGSVQLAIQEVVGNAWEFLGILDADIELPVNFYQRLMEEFDKDKRLGLAGGFLRSVLPDGSIAPGGFMSPNSVGGPIQTFRRSCYEDIGGLKTFGHADCVAVIQARDKGWKVRSFADIQGDHHVPFEGYSPKFRYKVPALYKLGKMDYIMYVPFWFVLIQSTARMFSRPFVSAGVARFAGYSAAVVSRPARRPAQKNWFKRQRMYMDTVTNKIRRVIFGVD
jgi:glycosyltransferase involved in cell wall biosynthesis